MDDAGTGEDFEYPCTVAENGNKRGLIGIGAGAAQLEWTSRTFSKQLVYPLEPRRGRTPTWVALRFSVEDPHYYSYVYESDGRSFSARAHGDLDCDGTLSTFEMVGRVDEAGNVTGSAGFFRWNELE